MAKSIKNTYVAHQLEGENCWAVVLLSPYGMYSWPTVLAGHAAAESVKDLKERSPYNIPPGFRRMVPHNQDVQLNSNQTKSLDSKDPNEEIAKEFPKYHKQLPAHWTCIDTYRVNELFPIEDNSGRLLHVRKKLLVPGVRTGGKSMVSDLREAYKTLGNWISEAEARGAK